MFRPYQDRARLAVLKAIADGARAPCLVAPTGSGKTFMGIMLALELASGKPILWLTHRAELIEQAVASLRRSGVDRVSVLRANDTRVDDGAQVTVASIQTLMARELRPGAAVIVWDEAQHSKASQWSALAADYARSIILGLTATPERSDGKALGDIFDALIEAASYSELTAAGHLVPCEVIAPRAKLSDGALAMSPDVAIAAWAPDDVGIVFCSSVGGARELADRLSLARCIDGGTAAVDRAGYVDAYQLGFLDWLTNFEVLTEGFDSPRARVCVLARPCGHISAYLQIVGRVLRPFPGKESALLIDLTGKNVERFGIPGTDMDYSLEGSGISPIGGGKKKKRNAWVCPACFVALASLPADRICPKCHVPVPRRIVEQYEHDNMERRVAWRCPKCGRDHYTFPVRCLACGELSARGAVAARDNVASRRAWYDKMLGKALDNRWKPGWAAMQYKTKYGMWPPWSWKVEAMAKSGLTDVDPATVSGLPKKMVL